MDGSEVLLGRGLSSPPHLDTVRALHQTVVSLRTALELSKHELKELKEKYQQQSRTNYEDTIEKLTLENHILRRKIIDTQVEVTYDLGAEANDSVQDSSVQFETYSSEHVEKPTQRDELVVELTEEVYNDTVVLSERICDTIECDKSVTSEKLSTGVQNNSEAENSVQHNSNLEKETFVNPGTQSNQSTEELLLSQPHTLESKTFKTKIELLSKFDVSIKVRTLEGEENFVSTTTSETESTTDVDVKEGETTIRHEEKFTQEVTLKPGVEQPVAEAMAVAGRCGEEGAARHEAPAVQARVTSQESVLVERGDGAPSPTLNLDNLSVRSLSEGDSSVFSERAAATRDAAGGNDGQAVDAGASEGDAGAAGEAGESSGDEEVDDIELIFTTDESKDMSNLQEDLVSIQECEPWVPTKSTPVLIKFHTLDPEVDESAGSERRARGVSVDPPDRPGILKSYDNKSDNYINKAGRRLESTDSLTCSYTRGLSFDNTKSSSFELGSSLDLLHDSGGGGADEGRRRRGAGRYSVHVATDISKCGVSEEELTAAALARRNTCPNPFQYRPLPPRPHARAPGPFKARSRPALRAGAAEGEGQRGRRESGAQTELSALPPRWSSDGYLAHKGARAPPPTTLPSRAAPDARAPRRHAPADLRPRTLAPAALSAGGARRVMLSDIGFTSMVPELSRSADPVWAVGGAACGAACGACGSTLRSPAASPPPAPLAPHPARDAARYLARNTFLSTSHSVDRGYDFSSSYVPALAIATCKEQRGLWRSSLPDVRGSTSAALERTDTDELLEDAEAFLRRSIDNLRPDNYYSDAVGAGAGSGAVRGGLSRPYIPVEPRHLRLGHTVKIITPNGRIAIGTVRYVGVAGAAGGVRVGAALPSHGSCLPHNDGTLDGRRYFRAPPGHTAVFVPFGKVVMAWAN